MHSHRSQTHPSFLVTQTLPGIAPLSVASVVIGVLMTPSGRFQPRKPSYNVAASNKHFIVLIDSVGQDLKEDPTGMTDLQCTLSGPHLGR